MTQIASKHGVHPSQLRRWREAALTAMPANFADEAQFQKHLAVITEQHDKEKEKLYAEIGKLTTQLNWLKKKAESVGISTEPDEVGRTRRK